MNRHFLVRLSAAAALAVLLTLPAATRADTVSFSKGALIIPMQSYFQPKGGMVSAYGLVYRILLSNAPGHLNASSPVTVYIVNQTSKASPNRCFPTNLAALASGVPSKTDARWNDGCDMTISNGSMQPVVQVDYSTGWPASGLYPNNVAITTFNDGNAWPQWSTTTPALTTTNNFNSVSYLGGPFVIDAIDAPAVINLIRNGDTGSDAVPQAAIDLFSDSRKSAGSHCVPTSLDANTNGSTCLCTPRTCTSAGYNCGDADDGCGGRMNCSSTHTLGDVSCTTAGQYCGLGGPNKCGAPSGGGDLCGDQNSGCRTHHGCGMPAPCDTLNTRCGGNDDDSSAPMKDGICHSHSGTPNCAPLSQATVCAGLACGEVSDGCGGHRDCGDCGGNPSHCGAGGAGPNQCGATGTPACVPNNSCTAGGGTVCTPTVTACGANDCGYVATGCGTVIQCPGCPNGKLCGIGSPHQCGTPTPDLPTGCHYVYMHQATTSFNANVSRRINHAPKPFAVYQSFAGDSSRNGSPAAGVLAAYIKISGLWAMCTGNGSDTIGCPVGNVSNCTFNGSTPAGLGVEAADTQIKHGVIYDEFDTADMDYSCDTNGAGNSCNIGGVTGQPKSSTLPHGILNYAVSGNPYYSLFWAPHWHTMSDSNGNDKIGMANVGYFINHGGNLMTECASITSYENGFNAPTGGLAGTPNDGVTVGTDFLFTGGITVNSTASGKNCTDPGSSGGCANYPNPGNVFAQVGDWTYQYESGENDGFKAKTGVQTWTLSMVNSSNGQEAFDMGQPDSKHGAIVYVAGHDVSTQPVGSRIVLNSTLNLSADPIRNERALAAPVIAYGRTDATSYVDEVLNSSYQAISGYSLNNDVENFKLTDAQLWVFPYFPGNLTSRPLASGGPVAALATGESVLSDATSIAWRADGVGTLSGDPGAGIAPTPAWRNLFTYIGGFPVSGTASLLDGGAYPPRKVLQMYWVPSAVDGNALKGATQNVGGSANNCVDVLGVNAAGATNNVLYDDCQNGDATCAGNALRLVRGAPGTATTGADGLCDVQEMLNISALADNSTWSTGGADYVQYQGDTTGASLMLQRVRGYCFGTSDHTVNGTLVLQPTYTQCADGNDDLAHVGGLVHSTPALVAASPHIPDQGNPRPSVAYVGGFDGQLHAFYVGGGDGYQGPANTLHFPYYSNPTDVKHDASPTFATALGGDTSVTFHPPSTGPGTELWSFIPASQLPQLRSNNGRVDSSPVVMDVYADFGGTGVREWHTVLVASVGKQGTEMFAMDVTNPLKPRLLWDIVGSTFLVGSSPNYSPTLLLSDAHVATASSSTFGVASCTATGFNALPADWPVACDVPKWNEESAQFVLPPGTDTGRLMTKSYDYQDLGGSNGLAGAEIRVGIEPAYYIYAATNMPPGRFGIEVFGIDAATGQKQWQWEHAYGQYTPTPVDQDNVVPPTVSLIFDAMGASRVLVGDYEGRVWELDGATGMNVNTTTNSDFATCTVASPCKYPAFDGFKSAPSGATYSQPVTTNVAVARLPILFCSQNSDCPTGDTCQGGICKGTTLLGNFPGATLLVFGTAGSDSLANPDNIPGNLHVLLYDPQYRVPLWTPQSSYGASCCGSNLATATYFTSASQAQTMARATGVLQEPIGFPWTAPARVLPDGRERVYGEITISGDVAFFSTATGSVPSDIMKTMGTVHGHAYALDLGTASGTATASGVTLNSNYANYGGLAVYVHNGNIDSLLGAEVGQINRIAGSGGGFPTADAKPNAALAATKRSLTYKLRNWIMQWLKIP